MVIQTTGPLFLISLVVVHVTINYLLLAVGTFAVDV